MGVVVVVVVVVVAVVVVVFSFPPPPSFPLSLFSHLNALRSFSQSYRFAGRSILPSTRADGELDLRTLRSSSITDELVLLMSAGKPGDQQRAGPGEGGGLATMERSAGSATMQETDESGEGGGAKRNTAAASSSSFEETPGQRLGGGIAAAAETAALSAAERRKLQADAAARRFGA